MSKDDDNTSNLPDYLQEFRQGYEKIVKKEEKRVKLPVLSQISASMKAKISALPPPNSWDLEKAENYAKGIAHIDSGVAYGGLKEVSDRERVARHLAHFVPPVDVDTLAGAKFLSIKATPSSGIRDAPIPVDESSDEYFKAMEVAKAKEDERRKKLQPPLLSVKYKRSIESRTIQQAAKASIQRSLPHLDHEPVYPFKTELIDLLAAPTSTTAASPNATPMAQSSSISAVLPNKGGVSKGRAPPSYAPPTVIKSTTAPSSSSGPRPVLSEVYQPVLLETALKAEQVSKTLESTLVQHAKAKDDMKISELEHDEFMFYWKSSLLDDMGLDVDRGFSLRRRQAKVLDIIFFHMSVQHCRSAVLLWKEFTIIATERRRQLAAVHICRVVRGFLGRRRASYVRGIYQQRVVAEQARERARQARIMLIGANLAGTLVRLLRRKVKRRKRREAIAARKIQARARGMLVRNRLARIRLRDAKALIIQCFFRQCRARYRVRVYRKISGANKLLSAVRQERNARCGLYVLNGASIVISRGYSCYKIRRGLKVLVFYNRMRLAVIIQRYYRGYVKRKLFLKMKRLKLKEDRRIYRAAATIQKIMRGFLARQKYKTMLILRDAEKILRREQKVERMGSKEDRDRVRRSREILRALMPLRFLWENSRAVKIQRVYRGHRGRKSALRNKIITILKRDAEKQYKIIRAATDIQRVWKGYVLRRIARKQRRRDAATSIQALWRGRKARKQIKAARERQLRVNRLCHFLFSYAVKLRYHRNLKQNFFYREFATTIQCAARKYLARKRVRLRKDSLRSLEERSASGRLSLIKAVAGCQLMILTECLTRDIGKSSPTISGVQCPCLGPLQAIFVSALGAKGKTEADTLVTNRVSLVEVTKILQRIDGLFDYQDPRLNFMSTVISGKEALKMRKKAMTSTLIKALELGLVDYLPKARPLTLTDIDMSFTKCKDGGQSTLTFLEFCNLIRFLGNIYFGFDQTSINDDQPSTNSRPSSPEEPLNAVRPRNQVVSATDLKTISSSASEDRKAVIKSQRDAKSRKKVRERFIYNLDSMKTDGKNAGFIIWILLIAANKSEPMGKSVIEWLEIESKARLSVLVKRIQTISKLKQARMWREIFKSRKETQRRLERRQKAAIKMTAFARSFVQRQHVRRYAQRFLVKYIPPDGKPYWYNPVTGLTKYVKPKILARRDCIAVSIPPVGLEFVVQCGGCDKSAHVNCGSCDDSYCHTCFDNMHCKGKRSRHRYDKIHLCAYCRYQMATKSCVTCFMKPPKPGSVQELILGDRGLFCDSCFSYLHDERERRLEMMPINEKLAQTMIADRSKDAFLIAHTIRESVQTDHMYTHLVEPCEECKWRGAAWRCTDCRQVYCSKCLLGLHSIGGPFSRHRAEVLPYYTPDMHQRFQNDELKFIQKSKLEILNRKENERRKAFKMASILRIQSWWRMKMAQQKVSKLLKHSRRILRREWRSRKKEDRLVRNTMGYAITNFFGAAPMLSTDNREESALREVPWVFRQRAREYIWKNMSDWGFYRTSRTEPQKGEPKRAFDVGETEELVDQAVYGGYRLPGMVTATFSKNRIQTKYDLSTLIQPGQFVRIQNRVFMCIEINDNSVTIDRCFDIESTETILYLLPSFMGEKGRRYWKLVFNFQKFVISNPVTQTYATLHQMLMSRIANFGLGQALMLKKQKKLKGYARWKKFSDLYERRAKWAENIINSKTDGGNLIDVSKMLSPEQIAKEKEAKDLAKRLEKERKKAEAALKKLRAQESKKLERAKKESERKKKEKEAAEKAAAAAAAAAADTAEATKESQLGYKKTDIDEPSLLGDDSSLESGSQVDLVESSSVDDHPPGWLHDEDEDEEEYEEDEESTKVPVNAKPPPWKANEKQLYERMLEESTLSRQELAARADDWVQYIDPLTDNEYYVHRVTNELSYVRPACVEMKAELEEEAERNKKNYDEAQRRLEIQQRISKGKKRMVVKR